MTDGRVPSKLGLIAGEGRFPFMVLEEASRLGVEVLTLGVRGEADPDLESAAKTFEWIGIGELSKSIRLLRDAGISQAVLAGRVRHVRVFDLLRPDRLMLRVLRRIPSRSTDAMLRTLADVFAEEGVTLIDSTLLLARELADAGPMSRRKPSAAEREDIEFGAAQARGLAALDIGQTVVIKKKSVVAAEAMEGSDAAIRRAPTVVSGPFTVVKVARPRQDPRFDVPVVGPNTVESMREAGATSLAVEAGKVLLLDREELLARADRYDMVVYGVESD